MGARQNESRDCVIAQTLTASSVGTGSTQEYTFTVQGLRTGDVVAVNRPSSQSNVGIAGARVSANDTLAITYFNLSTTASATPTAEEYKIYVYRPERTFTGGVVM